MLAQVAQANRQKLTDQERLEDNPVEYLVSKARKGEELTNEEARIMWGISKNELVKGMKQDAGGDTSISFSAY